MTGMAEERLRKERRLEEELHIQQEFHYPVLCELQLGHGEVILWGAA